ncbi:MAG TPA: ABC transporter permease [Bryobacteraceae bacterium]|nr:ABC transporter permease [Bryobacteraceae bacterium]
MALRTTLQDVRYAARMFQRNVSSTALAVFTLALGIGLNTATFTAYKAMVARSIDAVDPASIVNLGLIDSSGQSDFRFSYRDYEAYRDALRSFKGFIAENHEMMALSGAGPMVSQRTAAEGSLIGRLGLLPSAAGNAEFAMTFSVSDNYFAVLGVNVVQGRTFQSMTPAELRSAPPALISENYWRKRFSEDPTPIGRTVRLNGAEFTIVGVTPRNFTGTFIAVPDFWIPLSISDLVHPGQSWLRDSTYRFCRLNARLAPGSSIEEAEAEMTLVANQLHRARATSDESNKRVAAEVWPGSPFPRRLNPGLKLAVLLIMLSVALVLVIACANVAGLQLARATSRENEMSIRRSLGAAPSRIVRQLLTECACLALLAGSIALFFTWILLNTGVTILADAFPAEYGSFIFYVAPDLAVFAYVLAISVCAGILFGLAPAIEGSRGRLHVSKGTSVRTRRWQDLLVSAQVCVSTVLLVCGGLFIRSSIRSVTMDTGYNTSRIASLRLQFLEHSGYSQEQKLAVIREFRNRLIALPGVAAITSAPAANEGRIQRTTANGHRFFYNYVEANYFRTVGIPLLHGAGFSPLGGDDNSIILSDSAARRLWPGENPIGRTVRIATENQSERAYQVIAVARDIRGFLADGSDARQVYLPLPEGRLNDNPLLVRTHGDPAQFIRAIDAIVPSVDPNLVVYASTLEQLLRQTASFILSTISAAVASTVGLLGLLLTLMGIYGAVSYLVVLRTREMGIRIAIGAQKRDIAVLVLQESMRPVLAGLAVGLIIAAGTSYVLRFLLYGVGIVDGISFGSVSAFIVLLALIAAYIPSRRAMRVDPIVALRYE